MCTPKSLPDPKKCEVKADGLIGAPEWDRSWAVASPTVRELQAEVAQLRMACTDALEYHNKGADHSGRWSIDYHKLRETLIKALVQTQSK